MKVSNEWWFAIERDPVDVAWNARLEAFEEPHPLAGGHTGPAPRIGERVTYRPNADSWATAYTVIDVRTWFYENEGVWCSGRYVVLEFERLMKYEDEALYGRGRS